MELELELPNSYLKIVYMGRDDFVRVTPTGIGDVNPSCRPSTTHLCIAEASDEVLSTYTVGPDDANKIIFLFKFLHYCMVVEGRNPT